MDEEEKKEKLFTIASSSLHAAASSCVWGILTCLPCHFCLANCLHSPKETTNGQNSYGGKEGRMYPLSFWFQNDLKNVTLTRIC